MKCVILAGGRGARISEESHLRPKPMIEIGTHPILWHNRRDGTVCGYGAAAKGNTLLNYCRITPDDVAFVADVSPHEQGTLLPGPHTPVVTREYIDETAPARVLILPSNLEAEISDQLAHVISWGSRFRHRYPRAARDMKGAIADRW